MKKLQSNALQRFKESSATGTGVETYRNERELIRKIDQWVYSKGYYQAEQTMQQVADKLGVSHDELSWVCKRVYGESFLSLRKRLRLADACHMLTDYPDLPVAMIGYKVGIPDRTNFRRQFFSEFGMSPQEWRKKHRR